MLLLNSKHRFSNSLYKRRPISKLEFYLWLVHNNKNSDSGDWWALQNCNIIDGRDGNETYIINLQRIKKWIGIREVTYT